MIWVIGFVIVLFCLAPILNNQAGLVAAG